MISTRGGKTYPVEFVARRRIERIGHLFTMKNIKHQYNDGGRRAAGFSGYAGDCMVRAIAIVTGIAYLEVYEFVNRMCGKPLARHGVANAICSKILRDLGARWVAGHKLPERGKCILNMRGHLAAFIDGTLHDTHDSLERNKLYGYWQMPS